MGATPTPGVIVCQACKSHNRPTNDECHRCGAPLREMTCARQALTAWSIVAALVAVGCVL